jgi:cell division protein FtsL
MKGLKLRTIIGLFCLVLCAAGVLVAHVWKQNAYVRISMAAVKLAKQKAQLRNDIALLEVSVGGLKKISRIESMAKSRFGLEYGKTPVLVYLDGGPRSDEAGEADESDARAARTAQAGFGSGGGEQVLEARGLESGKVAWRINAY